MFFLKQENIEDKFYEYIENFKKMLNENDIRYELIEENVIKVKYYADIWKAEFYISNDNKSIEIYLYHKNIFKSKKAIDYHLQFFEKDIPVKKLVAYIKKHGKYKYAAKA